MIERLKQMLVILLIVQLVLPLPAQMAMFDKMIENDPDNIEHYFARGRALLTNEYNLEAAIADFTHVLEQDFRHFEARLFRAIAYFELGEVALAKEDATFARWIKEEDARLNAVLGIIYMHEKDYYLAADFFTRQIQLDSENPQGYINRAWALLMLPHYSEMALRDYDEALKKDKNNVMALYNRAEPLMLLGRAKEAEASITRAIHQEPGSIGLYFRRAMIRWHLHDYERALADNQQVLRMVQDDDEAMMFATLINMADIYLRRQQWYEAIFFSDLVIALEDEATLPAAYANRGIALLGLYAACDEGEQACTALFDEAKEMFDAATLAGFLGPIRLQRRLEQARLQYQQQAIMTVE